MPASVKLNSPAKLNLILNVNFKRSDGYHDLTTVFERIDLQDSLEFTLDPSGKISIFCSHPDVPCDESNLVYKVAQRLKDDFALMDGVTVKIDKRIPVAAGLAGGSSNAATALIALNKLWKLGLSFKDLLIYAAEIGSDVAFFLYDTSWALGQGRGEKLKPLKISHKYWHILIVAPVKLYARDVYEALDLKPQNILQPRGKTRDTNLLTKKRSNVNILTRFLKKNKFSSIENVLTNDLEEGILKLRPELLTLKESLKKMNTRGVCFSGSGPAVFGLIENKTDAEQMYRQLKEHYSQVFIVRTL